MSIIDSLNLYHKLKTKTTKINGNTSCKEYVWFAPNSVNHRKEHPKYQASFSSTTEESLYIHTAFRLIRKAPNGGCPVNPMQDKRTDTLEVSTILTIFEHNPLGLYGSVQSVTPGEKSKPWRKSNLHEEQPPLFTFLSLLYFFFDI